MRILFATMQFGRGYGQGTERYVAMLADGLRARGHEAVVLAGDPERRGPTLPLGAEREPDPDGGAGRPAVRMLHYPGFGWTTVRGAPPEELERVLAREAPDVVHLANPGHIGVGLVDAAHRRGIPVVMTVRDHWWVCPKHSWWHYRGHICDGRVTWHECLRCIAEDDPRPAVGALRRIPTVRGVALPLLYLRAARQRGAPWRECRNWTRRREVLKGALQAAEAVIFLSEAARARFAADLAPTRVHTIFVGLEPRWFEARRPAQPPAADSGTPSAPPGGAAARGDPPRDPAACTLGFVGALAEHKGPHLLLEALRRLQWTKTRVLLVGRAADAHYLARLRQLATAAPALNVEFVGPVPSAAMPDLLGALDLLVVPSMGVENLPQIVLEAQALGVPVLASRVDGLTEAIAEPKLLFNVGSSHALSAVLAAWVQEPRGTGEEPAGFRPTTAAAMVEATAAVYSTVVQPHDISGS